ncbi:MAG TPA: Asp-tRNA(Asn)/Glu-tRNA(Gln) amidotransferase subunit GatC [Candidatus Binataceae bacterium]|nr:Asp-tRNA(Asn)/Glu-tRNA(Gln) amidotransferase subunit GatC [Candidatus Binataceae bacterium]
MAAQRIDLETVRHVARLARLRLSSEEETRMQEDLSAVLAYVDKLNQLPTDDLEPTAQVGEAGTPLREDRITNQPETEALLANAPDRQGGFFRVPRIID